MHHIVTDGWSIKIFFRELAVLYGVFSSRKPSPLTDLPIQYADFVVWQRTQLQGDVLESQLAYWRKQLAGSALLALPVGRPKPLVQTLRGGIKNFMLPQALTKALRVLSWQEGATLFMTILASFQLLLHRLSGQDDVSVGSPIANRNRLEIEGLIGFFVNTVVMRTNLGGNPTFRELLQQVREVALGAYAHQDIPFEILVKELRPERNSSFTSPFINVWINFVDNPALRFESEGIAFSLLDSMESVARWPIALYIMQVGHDLRFRLLYQLELFSEEWMSTLLEQFQNLLQQIVTLPDMHIDSYTFIAPEVRPFVPDSRSVMVGQEQAPVAETFSAPPGFVRFAKGEIEQSLAERFESQVKAHPAKIAVEANGHALSYSKLNYLANNLVHNIFAENEDDPDVRTLTFALLLGHSIEMVIGFIGVLKSSGISVPLDPSYPEDRLAFMIEDSDARFIVTNATYVAQAEKIREKVGNKITIINITNIREETSVENPLKHADPESVAYMIYTSGSTGRAKGVMQTHRNVLHFIMNYTNGLRIADTDRLSLISSFSFSAAIMDTFAALLNGATLCLYDISQCGTASLGKWLKEADITVYHSVPTVFRHFVATLERGPNLPQLRLIDLGGEPVLRRDVELFKQHFSSDCVLVNGLGATELNVIRQFVIGMKTEVAENNVPSGFAVEDTEIILLDNEGRDVGFNRTGEIVIRSRYLSPGYWKNPELTDATFKHDQNSVGTRYFYSGDLGCMRSNGCLEHMGRKDRQVKMRGIRIEPGEVEEALLALKTVREAVVLICKDHKKCRNILVAYVVPLDTKQVLTSEELWATLGKTLPSVMIPSIFVILAALPQTLSGKIDIHALPSPWDCQINSRKDFLILPTHQEEAIAEIWSDLLDIEHIGVHENFFLIGGDSLLATQVVSRIQKMFQVDISLRSFFNNPTVSGLAKALLPDYSENELTEELIATLADLESMSEEDAERAVEEYRMSNKCAAFTV